MPSTKSKKQKKVSKVCNPLPTLISNSQSFPSQFLSFLPTASSFPLLMTKDHHKSSNQEELNHIQHKLSAPQLQKGPTLSLGSTGAVQRSCESKFAYTHHPFSSTSSFFDRESISSSSCMMINSNCCNNNLFNEASQSNGEGSNQTHQQQPEDLQNLLQLGHAMFEVELL